MIETKLHMFGRSLGRHVCRGEGGSVYVDGWMDGRRNVGMYVCIYAYMHVYMYVCLSNYLSSHLFFSQCFYLPVYLPICLPISLFFSLYSFINFPLSIDGIPFTLSQKSLSSTKSPSYKVSDFCNRCKGSSSNRARSSMKD